jgi:ABC-type transport system involved in cytochrome bd biosynthesis fused ATPase/permease subunit
VAKKKTFYEQPVDRTPYGACAGVATSVVVLFGLGAWGIWHLATIVKHSSLSLSLPAIHSQSTPDIRAAADVQTENIQQQINKAVQSQSQKAVDAATEAAKQEVVNQAKSAAQSPQQYEKYLNQ